MSASALLSARYVAPSRAGQRRTACVAQSRPQPAISSSERLKCRASAAPMLREAERRVRRRISAGSTSSIFCARSVAGWRTPRRADTLEGLRVAKGVEQLNEGRREALRKAARHVEDRRHRRPMDTTDRHGRGVVDRRVAPVRRHPGRAGRRAQHGRPKRHPAARPRPRVDAGRARRSCRLHRPHRPGRRRTTRATQPTAPARAAVAPTTGGAPAERCGGGY